VMTVISHITTTQFEDLLQCGYSVWLLPMVKGP
jgi:hypothetical protein